jgi:hypothetical protein
MGGVSSREIFSNIADFDIKIALGSPPISGITTIGAENASTSAK